MGGCRCTYRNCTVKSDGKTHKFHYPVFEKIRCHQWLVNAHRLDFLNLKVSQLKNRVVCQYHFKDEYFMNFKKDKLTFDAIPTENGPYCDPTNYVDSNQDTKLYSIIVDDIDSENMSDKKAISSMKYGDYLTNTDYMDLENTHENKIIYQKNNSDVNMCPTPEPKESNKDKSSYDDDDLLFKLSFANKSGKKQKVSPKITLAVPPYVNSNNVSQNNSNNKRNVICDNNNITLNFPHESLLKKEVVGNEPVQQKINKPKITIISEKKITNPLPITGKFEPVSPNFVLNISKRKNSIIPSSQPKNDTQPKECELFEVEILPDDKEETKIEEIKTVPSKSIKDNIQFESPLKTSRLKSRVPPERVEAINKKRKFNMKLREVIESCLDKLESPDNAMETVKPVEKNKIQRNIQPSRSVLTDTPVMANQDYTITFLEARMRKMENTLLEKIEQNSKKIIDLKNSFTKTTCEKKTKVQTRSDEEVYKKQLFEDISKYLSPSSKSLVYEELFINKFGVNDYCMTPAKRKRGNND